MKLLIILHRYLGVAVGVLMTLWCVSGFVMMYSPYPRLSTEQRIRGLPALSFDDCCALERVALAADAPAGTARIEMLGDMPVLRIAGPRGGTTFDLRSGAAVDSLDADAARRVAVQFAVAHGMDAATVLHAQLLGTIDRDQWTVQGASGRAPLFHFRFPDRAGTELYVSSGNGEVVQRTTRAQRFWGWLGAVPHWLYPTVLRANGALWTQVVVWTSLAGCFLTLTGIYLGVVRFTQRRRGRWSPYFGLWKWHHLTGLVFGVLTLTWVASGLLSMQPWGVFDSLAGLAERDQLAGKLPWSEARPLLDSAVQRSRQADAGWSQIAAAPLAGEPFALLRAADGTQQRLDAHGEPRPLDLGQLQAALAPLGRLSEPVHRLERADDYYYEHHDTLPFPVYRAVLADAQHTRLYLDAGTGALIFAFDRPLRAYRWWMNGLHSFDFAALRARPLWDLVVWPLLAGVTLACATGTWMSWRRVKRDLTPR